jgi:hypothetical protein
MAELPAVLKLLLVCYLVCCALFWQVCGQYLLPLLRRQLRQRADPSLQAALARIAELEARLAARDAAHGS